MPGYLCAQRGARYIWVYRSKDTVFFCQSSVHEPAKVIGTIILKVSNQCKCTTNSLGLIDQSLMSYCKYCTGNSMKANNVCTYKMMS